MSPAESAAHPPMIAFHRPFRVSLSRTPNAWKARSALRTYVLRAVLSSVVGRSLSPVLLFMSVERKRHGILYGQFSCRA